MISIVSQVRKLMKEGNHLEMTDDDILEALTGNEPIGLHPPSLELLRRGGQEAIDYVQRLVRDLQVMHLSLQQVLAAHNRCMKDISILQKEATALADRTDRIQRDVMAMEAVRTRLMSIKKELLVVATDERLSRTLTAIYGQLENRRKESE